MWRDGLFAPSATILVLNAAQSEKAAFQTTVLEHPVFLKALESGATVVWMRRLAVADEVDARRPTFIAAGDNRAKPAQTAIAP
jgi:hypothetical protein